jgi:hypothetical protein
MGDDGTAWTDFMRAPDGEGRIEAEAAFPEDPGGVFIAESK